MQIDMNESRVTITAQMTKDGTFSILRPSLVLYLLSADILLRLSFLPLPGLYVAVTMILDRHRDVARVEENGLD